MRSGYGPAVEHEAVALHADRAQRRVARDRRRAARRRRAQSCSSASIRVGVLGAPQQLVAVVVDAGVGEGDAAVHLAGDDRVACRRPAAARRARSVTSQRAGRRGASPSTQRLEADLPALDVAASSGRVPIAGRGHALEPDRLPDAGRARIPDRVRLELPVLLAARLGEVVRDRRRRARRPSAARGIAAVGDVGAERRVAAFVLRRRARR